VAINLRLTGGVYTLRNSKGEGLTLTEAEAFGLIQIARQLQDRLRSQNSKKKYQQIPTTDVHKIALSLDAHHTEVILRLVDEAGLEIGYKISPETTIGLRDGLAKKIEQMETAKATKKVQ
jgi:hypothetical protein